MAFLPLKKGFLVLLEKVLYTQSSCQGWGLPSNAGIGEGRKAVTPSIVEHSIKLVCNTYQDAAK